MSLYTALFILLIITKAVSLVRDTYACAHNETLGNPIVASIIGIVFVELIYDIVTFIFYYKRTQIGYYLNVGCLFITVISACIRQLLAQVFQGGYDYAFSRLMYIIPVGIVMLLVWTIPNYIYFKNRRHLFNSAVDVKPTYPSRIETHRNDGHHDGVRSRVNDEISVDSMRSLKKLYDQGILTEDEFNEKKRQMLGL